MMFHVSNQDENSSFNEDNDVHKHTFARVHTNMNPMSSYLGGSRRITLNNFLLLKIGDTLKENKGSIKKDVLRTQDTTVLIMVSPFAR